MSIFRPSPIQSVYVQSGMLSPNLRDKKLTLTYNAKIRKKTTCASTTQTNKIDDSNECVCALRLQNDKTIERLYRRPYNQDRWKWLLPLFGNRPYKHLHEANSAHKKKLEILIIMNDFDPYFQNLWVKDRRLWCTMSHIRLKEHKT